MKKEKIISATIGLCLAASLFAGCDKATGESAAVSQLGGGQTQISVESSQTNNAATEGQYCFTFNGYKIMPGTEVAPAIAVLGDNYEFLEQASCAGQGTDRAYMYSGFTIGAYKAEGIEYIKTIVIVDSLTDCDGLHVGDSFADAKALLGAPDYEDDYILIYKASNTQLWINAENGMGEITEIVYTDGE